MNEVQVDKQRNNTMKTLVEVITALIQTLLIISSPALVAWAAYLVQPELGLAGLGVGMIAGPLATIKLFDAIS